MWSGSSAWFDSVGGCPTGLAHYATFLFCSLFILIDGPKACRKIAKTIKKGTKRMVKNISKTFASALAVSSGLTLTRQDEYDRHEQVG